jgi:hypothetical protein
VRPEPHPLSAAGVVKRCGSGAKPNVQNRTIKKKTSVAEPHHVDAAPGKIFDAAPASTLHSRPTFLKSKKVH